MATATTSVYDCPICCGRYKIPKILPCGHSFCLNPCLQNFIQSNSPNCPLCRIQIKLPPSGKVEDLPTNFALQSVVAVSTSTNEAYTPVNSSNAAVSFEQKCCVKHNKEFIAYCQTCSELLCQTCTNERQDHEHDTFKVQEAVDKYCNILLTVQENLMVLHKKSDDIFNSLKDRKERCKAEANSVRTEIDEAAEALIQQVKERRKELHLEVDNKEDNTIKQLDDVEAKGAELSLFSDCTNRMCQNLKTELTQLDFKRKRAVESISKKTATLLEEASDLEKEADKDQESIVFKVDKSSTCLPLGEILGSFERKEAYMSLSKLTDLSFNVPSGECYNCFSMLSTNSLVFLSQPFFSSMLRVYFRMGQSEGRTDDVDFLGTISKSTFTRVNNITKFVFVTTNQTLVEATLNDTGKGMCVGGSITLRNSLLYQVSAASWDDTGTKCYTLLSDGVTINVFTFSPEKKETFHVKLEKKVKCSSSRRFHVCQFGMAICDEEKREVRFYETRDSPKTTCIIKAPPDMKSSPEPVCVVSLKKDKKWLVLWAHRFERKSFIYQYSASFKYECVLLNGIYTRLNSLFILGEHYVATEEFQNFNNQTKVVVSVYYLERCSTFKKE